MKRRENSQAFRQPAHEEWNEHNQQQNELLTEAPANTKKHLTANAEQAAKDSLTAVNARILGRQPEINYLSQSIKWLNADKKNAIMNGLVEPEGQTGSGRASKD